MVFAVCDDRGPAFDIGVWNLLMLIGKWASSPCICYVCRQGRSTWSNPTRPSDAGVQEPAQQIPRLLTTALTVASQPGDETLWKVLLLQRPRPQLNHCRCEISPRAAVFTWGDTLRPLIHSQDKYRSSIPVPGQVMASARKDSIQESISLLFNLSTRSASEAREYIGNRCASWFDNRSFYLGPWTHQLAHVPQTSTRWKLTMFFFFALFGPV